MKALLLIFLTILPGCAAEIARTNTGSAVVPAPPVSGVVRRGSTPIVAATVEVCVASSSDGCTGTKATTTTDAGGHFDFARGSWGTIPMYDLFGPPMRLVLIESGKSEVLFEGMLVSEPTHLLILPSCDVAEGPDHGCGVAWALEN